MPQILNQSSEGIVTIDSFKGINSHLQSITSPMTSEAVNMRNFRIDKSGRLIKRSGYYLRKSFSNANSVWYGKLGDNNYLALKDNDKIYIYNMTSGVQCGYDILETPYEALFFMYNSLLYIFCGHVCLTFDGTTLCRINPYVPTIMIATSPAGEGVLHESINCISFYVKISYSPNGTALVYNFPSDLIYLNRVELNGSELSSSLYTVDYANRTVTFVSPPAGGVPNSLVMTFRRSTGENSMIHFFKDKKITLYGNEANCRVFLWGGDNIIYYTELTDDGHDPTFFPAENFITVGDGTYPVTSVCRHYNRLMIFTSRDTWYIAPSTVIYDGYTKSTFPLYPLNSKIGCITKNAACLIDNMPVCIMSNGVYRWTSSNIQDERNAECISSRVEGLLTESFLKSCITYDNEALKEFWIASGGIVYIYNYDSDLWYCFDNINVLGFFDYDGNVGFFNSTGIYAFSDYLFNDCGNSYTCLWESAYINFSKSYTRKDIRRLYINAIPNRYCTFSISLQPDNSPVQELSDISDYCTQTPISGKPTVKKIRLNIKHTNTLKIRIESNQQGARLDIISLQLFVKHTNEVKA